MSSDDLGYTEIDGDETELVPAVFARDAEEAQRYCELLADHGIVGVVAQDGVDAEGDDVLVVASERIGMTRGVAVLVAYALLDEAGVVISDREDLGEFQFDEDDESEDDDNELDFAQGIDSEFEDDTETGGADMLSSDLDGLDGLKSLDSFGVDFDEEDDNDLDEEPGGEFDKS